MRRAALIRLLFGLSATGMVLAGLVLINSLGCNYEMHLSSKEADYYAVCRAGKFTVIERDRYTKAKWMVSAYQAVLGNQLIFLVTDRTLIERPDKQSALSDINQVEGTFSMPLNYGWQMITPEQIAIFQHSPHPNYCRATLRAGSTSTTGSGRPPRCGRSNHRLAACAHRQLSRKTTRPPRGGLVVAMDCLAITPPVDRAGYTRRRRRR
ncbi:hypothetical protein FT673_02415 [Aeromonas hydrophila]|nr:hypothetical protein FT673_02415 [Aeromonas hydrophila]